MASTPVDGVARSAHYSLLNIQGRLPGKMSWVREALVGDCVAVVKLRSGECWLPCPTCACLVRSGWAAVDVSFADRADHSERHDHQHERAADDERDSPAGVGLLNKVLHLSGLRPRRGRKRACPALSRLPCRTRHRTSHPTVRAHRSSCSSSSSNHPGPLVTLQPVERPEDVRSEVPTRGQQSKQG